MAVEGVQGFAEGFGVGFRVRVSSGALGQTLNHPNPKP